VNEPTRCLICRKALKGEPSLVHMSTLSVVYAEGHDAAVTPEQDQGWFEVGSDCYRKVVKAGDAGLRR